MALARLGTVDGAGSTGRPAARSESRSGRSRQLSRMGCRWEIDGSPGISSATAEIPVPLGPKAVSLATGTACGRAQDLLETANGASQSGYRHCGRTPAHIRRLPGHGDPGKARLLSCYAHCWLRTGSRETGSSYMPRQATRSASSSVTSDVPSVFERMCSTNRDRRENERRSRAIVGASRPTWASIAWPRISSMP